MRYSLFLFAALNKLILKLIWKSKGVGIAKIILSHKSKVGKHILPNLTTYYKATVIKTGWYW